MTCLRTTGQNVPTQHEPVYDTVHTRVTKGQWPAGNELGETVWLNYEPGKGASTQPTKAVRHDFTIDHVGDTNTPDRQQSETFQPRQLNATAGMEKESQSLQR